MTHALEDFLRALRAGGVPVSPWEAVDAHRAAEAVGFTDRTLFKDALCAVLAKSEGEAARFDATFETFFDRRPVRRLPPASDAQPELAEASGSPLAQMLLAGDTAGLAAAMEEAAMRAQVQQIRLATQRNLLTRRLLDEMGAPDVARILAIAHKRAGSEAAAEALQAALATLAQDAKAHVERQFQIYARQSAREMREAQLARQALNTDAGIDPEDQALMRQVVRRMARRLAHRYARRSRRALRGHLDVRRTLRRSMAHGGVPFDIVWKTRKVQKPSIVCLCDVSKSVAAAAQFLLTFLYSLNEVVEHLESYAFSGRLVDVGELLDRLPIEHAIVQVLRENGYQQTNYGQALQDFAERHMAGLDRRTTIIVLGDARSNYADPRLDIFAEMRKRCRAVIWLNPEPQSYWGHGDSVMPRYARFCHVAKTCNTLEQLERIIDDVLRTYLPH